MVAQAMAVVTCLWYLKAAALSDLYPSSYEDFFFFTSNITPVLELGTSGLQLCDDCYHTHLCQDWQLRSWDLPGGLNPCLLKAFPFWCEKWFLMCVHNSTARKKCCLLK